MSNLVRPNIARVTRAALSASGSAIISKNTVGTICQHRPYLSFSQPQAIS
jgi:hypothetical protein